MDRSPTRLLCPWDLPGKNTGVGCHFLLQGIFPTQGVNPGLLYCRQILYQWATREAHMHLSLKNLKTDISFWTNKSLPSETDEPVLNYLSGHTFPSFDSRRSCLQLLLASLLVVMSQLQKYTFITLSSFINFRNYLFTPHYENWGFSHLSETPKDASGLFVLMLFLIFSLVTTVTLNTMPKLVSSTFKGISCCSVCKMRILHFIFFYFQLSTLFPSKFALNGQVW